MARPESIGDILTPPALAHHPEQGQRARAWSGTCVLVGAVAAGFAGIHFNTGDIIGGVLDSIGACLLLGGAIYLQASGQLNGMVQLSCVVCIGLALKSIVAPDNTSVSTLALYCLPPLLSTVALGRRRGLPWTAAALLIPPFYALSQLGEGGESFALLLALIILFAALGALMWNYEITGDELRMERDEALDALTAARQDTSSIAQAQNQFVKNMSHEFRTPLNHIVGATQLLRQTNLTTEQLELLTIAESSGSELISVVDDAIAMQELDRGSLQLEPEWIDLHIVLARIQRGFQPTAAARYIQFTCEIDPAIPKRLFGDPNRIEQIHRILLNNALSFTKEGTISMRAIYLGKGQIRFEVEDSGEGIASDKLNEIFEPFFQVDASDSRRHGGLGAGLTLSRQLARLMKGDITAKSIPGIGSTFYFEATLEEAKASKKRGVTQARKGPERKARVALADPNPKTRQGFFGMLERMGLQAIAVGSQRELIELISAQPIDVVFIDSELPGKLLPADLLLHLQRRSHQKEAVFVSLIRASDTHMTKGFDDHLPKPLRREQVVTVMRRWENKSHRS